MDSIPPDVAKRLLNRDFANLIKRVQSGGKISRAERAMLQTMASDSSSDAPPFSKDYAELAIVLGVSRQAVNSWKKFEDAPQPRTNGLHDVQAWREFMARRGLKGGDIGPTDEQSRLKARKLLAEVEEREFRLSVRRGEFVAVEQVRREWTILVGRARALLEARLLNELPPVLSGKDAHGIREELEKLVIEFYETLHAGGQCTP
jgi:hypothetical protein